MMPINILHLTDLQLKVVDYALAMLRANIDADVEDDLDLEETEIVNVLDSIE